MPIIPSTPVSRRWRSPHIEMLEIRTTDLAFTTASEASNVAADTPRRHKMHVFTKKLSLTSTRQSADVKCERATRPRCHRQILTERRKAGGNKAGGNKGRVRREPADHEKLFRDPSSPLSILRIVVSPSRECCRAATCLQW